MAYRDKNTTPSTRITTRRKKYDPHDPKRSTGHLTSPTPHSNRRLSHSRAARQHSPAARLVDALRHEVGRERVLELPPVLERIVRLRVRHRAGLEPAVEHLRDAAQRRLARPPRRDRQLVHAADGGRGGRVVSERCRRCMW